MSTHMCVCTHILYVSALTRLYSNINHSNIYVCIFDCVLLLHSCLCCVSAAESAPFLVDSDWTPQFLIMGVQRWKASCILWYCKYINFFPVNISPSLPFCFYVSVCLSSIVVYFSLALCFSPLLHSLSLSLALSGWSTSGENRTYWL